MERDDRPALAIELERRGSVALDTLAERLRFQLDRLDPGLVDLIPWQEACERERNLYRELVNDLSRFVDLWSVLEQSSRDHRVDGEAELTE